MKVSEIRDLSIKELTDKSKELKEDIFRLKWQKGMNQLENTSKIGSVKRDLARMLTILKEKTEKEGQHGRK